MNIFKQLLREFWIPSLVCLIWSAINIFTSSNEDWSFTKIVNIAAPTFFFASWLTAQYFRVRKQEHVSSSLSTIEERVDNVLGRIEKQANELQALSKTSFYRTFDECLYRLREAKEELADTSRILKSSNDIDANIFSLHKGNPFYNIRRELDMTIGYANHILNIDQHNELNERFTRFSYHIEELAGHIGVYIGRLNHNDIEWKTKRSCGLINEISNKVEFFNKNLLPHSKYASDGYKGGQQLEQVLFNHIEKLRTLSA